jgi:hypothetical protein
VLPGTTRLETKYESVDDYHLLGDDAVWLSHGVISQKMIIIIVTAVETSNLTYESVV